MNVDIEQAGKLNGVSLIDTLEGDRVLSTSGKDVEVGRAAGMGSKGSGRRTWAKDATIVVNLKQIRVEDSVELIVPCPQVGVPIQRRSCVDLAVGKQGYAVNILPPMACGNVDVKRRRPEIAGLVWGPRGPGKMAEVGAVIEQETRVTRSQGNIHVNR